MPIKIGNVEIATVFKGNTELDNIRLGDLQQWVGIIVTPDPSIAYVSRTTTSLTFDLTNNHTETVTIYYGTGNPYPNGSTVSVAASATERVTLSGLADGTSFTISAVALEAEQLPSVGTVSFTQSTATATTAAPSIFNVNPDLNSVSFTLRNNDDETAVVYYEVNDSTPDIQVTLAPNATTNRTISSLSSGTSYTLFARAKQANENFSSTVSTGFTTDALPFTLGTASYDNVSYNIGGSIYGMTFNNTGSKMYVVDQVSDLVKQYSLPTPFDISTVTNDNVTFNVGSQDGNPTAIEFNDNGTKMFVPGTATSHVYQYSLSTAFNVSTASYDNVSFFFNNQDFQVRDIKFNPNGTKMFMVGTNSDRVYQYSLSSPFNISTLSYDNVNLYVGSQESTPGTIVFNNTGSKLFMLGWGRNIHQYSLSTPYNLSGASYDNVNYYATEESFAEGLYFNPDGSRFFIVGPRRNKVYQYTNVY